MKCIVCKTLNVMREAKKHLNSTTFLTLSQCFKNLKTIEQIADSVVQSNCTIHNDKNLLAKHLSLIGNFSLEMKSLLAKETGATLPQRAVQEILNRIV